MAAFRFRSIEFDDQQGLHVQRIADIHESFSGMDGRAIHHLHACRDNPFGNRVSHALSRAFDIGKANQQGPRGLRLGQYPDRHFRHHPE